ncbi:MAG: hypothetical protein P8R42_02405 [Candidatus Binatia bacterium]|nr:hypothetical protein [Candidatus Binatia bacterium]
MLFKPGGNGGKLKIVAKGENWPWELGGPNDLVRVHWRVENEWFCVEAGGVVKKNESGLYKAAKIAAPASCPTEVCGNGVVELTPDHLQAIYEWIRGGAPEDTVVSGTAELLATCLPDP